ncbi:MAG: DUF2917 domain-containing protein [Chloroflexota bacterium]
MVYSPKLFHRFARTPKPLVTRLMLYAKEVQPLKQGQHITVVSGTAWITLNDEDIFLCEGQTLRLPTSPNSILISPLNKQSTVFEVR